MKDASLSSAEMPLGVALPDQAPLLWDRTDVPALLTLDKIADDVFQNRYNQDNINSALFGGQVLGQALAAATATVEGKSAHSLHCYFLRAGDAGKRIQFVVERIRDGGSFVARNVQALQSGRVILQMSCSFRQDQPGYVHQSIPLTVPPPEALVDLTEIAAREDGSLGSYGMRALIRGPIEVRPVSLADLEQRAGPAKRQFWIRVPSAVRADHSGTFPCVLAYLSDHWLAGVALMPHRAPVPDDRIFITSIDHSMWIHRAPANMNDWLLYETDSPAASGGTTLSRGLLFDRDGLLIASVCQETLQVKRR